MNAVAAMGLVNAIPLWAPVLEGCVVFSVPAVLAWSMTVGSLAVVGAALAMLAAGALARRGRPHARRRVTRQSGPLPRPLRRAPAQPG